MLIILVENLVFNRVGRRSTFRSPLRFSVGNISSRLIDDVLSRVCRGDREVDRDVDLSIGGFCQVE